MWESRGGFIDAEAAAFENALAPLPDAQQHQVDTEPGSPVAFPHWLGSAGGDTHGVEEVPAASG